MSALYRYAPGCPGIPPKWTTSAKVGAGTSTNAQSRVWFTISHGIIDEVYYPRLDQANTRDMGFLVADGANFFSEEKRQTKHEITLLEQGVPAYQLTNTCDNGRYRITKRVVTDPHRDVLLQQIRFESLKGSLADYGLYALLAPHIGNRGYENNAWVGDYKGKPMLFAQRNDVFLALACSTPFAAMSCGYVGFSDGWQDIKAHKRMTRFYSEASSGNVALTGEIDLPACNGELVLALSFGRTSAEAGERARAALLQDFEQIVQLYIQEWEMFQSRCLSLGKIDERGFDLYRISTAMLKTHEAKSFPGGVAASLSIPWGQDKGDDDLGGYHLVWPRDLVESAEGLLAAGDIRSARQTLHYLMSTQDADGHWPQNMWLDGTPYWHGVQMDETAFPILLADALRRTGGLNGLEPWPMIRLAASYLVRNGPVTPQDRWEEDGGYSPFTLAAEIAALLAAADFADEAGEKKAVRYLRQTADTWNDNIERWTYVTGTELAHKVGVQGYYVRLAKPEVADASSPLNGFVPIKNRPPGSSPTAQIVSTDALALVRFGLREADDPRIVNTVKVIDATLKTETLTGPVWHRYTGDIYGEREDGNAFNGTGIGRGWPLLTGERGHYHLARGNQEEARKLLRTIGAQTSPGGLIPEQVWDAPNISGLDLLNGHPAGSAMPLVWAHAEYIKLLRSLRDERVFDTPPQTIRRYQVDHETSQHSIWRFNHKCRSIPAGKILRIEVLDPAIVHWSPDGWQTVYNTKTQDTGLGIHFADLGVEGLSFGSTVMFTFYWPKAKRWEGTDFSVVIED